MVLSAPCVRASCLALSAVLLACGGKGDTHLPGPHVVRLDVRVTGADHIFVQESGGWRRLVGQGAEDEDGSLSPLQEWDALVKEWADANCARYAEEPTLALTIEAEDASRWWGIVEDVAAGFAKVACARRALRVRSHETGDELDLGYLDRPDATPPDFFSAGPSVATLSLSKDAETAAALVDLDVSHDPKYSGRYSAAEVPAAASVLARFCEKYGKDEPLYLVLVPRERAQYEITFRDATAVLRAILRNRPSCLGLARLSPFGWCPWATRRK